MRPVVLSGVLLAAFGCSSADAPATGDAGGPDAPACFFACLDATADLSPLTKVMGVLDQRCANADGCHGGGAGGLPISNDGSSGSEFTWLINVRSTEVPALYRVKPYDPAQSYVYMKLACEGGIEGGCMPADGPLDPTLVQAFHDWIEAGAPTQ